MLGLPPCLDNHLILQVEHSIETIFLAQISLLSKRKQTNKQKNKIKQKASITQGSKHPNLTVVVLILQVCYYKEMKIKTKTSLQYSCSALRVEAMQIEQGVVTTDRSTQL